MQLDLRHDNDTSTLRMNGRKLLEMREIECHLGVMKNTSGSAMSCIGNTKVVAFVQGPHQITQRQGQTGLGVQGTSTKGILNVSFFVTNFSTIDHQADVKKDQ